ncbi:MAG: hypothetical protein ACI4JC_09610 [Faecalibacterium sp.]
MRITKRIFALILAAAVLILSLTGCKQTLTNVAHKILGTSNEVEEEDTTRWAEEIGGDLILEGIADPAAKYDSAMANGHLSVVFNGIWSRRTAYFTVPSGTLTITASGTAEGTQKFKVAVWQKVEGGAQYVTGSTGYFKTGGAVQQYTVTGLDPNASYRLTISYDSSRYYLYGLLKAEGVA